MLNKLRTELKSVTISAMWVIAICFIVTIFYNWGMQGKKSRFSAEDLIIVNGEPIKIEELKEKYAYLSQLYGQFYGNKINSQQLLNMTIESAIEEKLFLQLAKKYKIKVSKHEVEKYIKDLPDCQTDGKFDSKKYNDFIEKTKDRQKEIIENIEKTLMTTKLQNLIFESVKVTKEEVLENYKRENEKVKFRYIYLNPTKYENKITMNDDELKKYFETHKSDYIVNEKVKVEYLFFDLHKIREKNKIDSNEIFKYYQEHLNEYEKDGYRTAEHILVKITSEEQKDTKKDKEALTLSQKLLKKAKETSTFATFGEEQQKLYKNVKYEYLPQIRPGQMVKPFEEAVFKMQQGEVLNEVIKTEFGYHIIRLIEIKDDYTEKFKDVKTDIEYKLAYEKAKQIAEKELRKFNKKLRFRTFNNLAKLYNKKYGLEKKETPFFEKNSPVEDLSQEFNEAAFSIKKIGKMSSPVKIDNRGFCILRLKEKQKSTFLKFEEVKPQVEMALKKEKTKQEICKIGRTILESLKEKDWEMIIKEYNDNIDVGETKNSVKYNDEIPGIGKISKVNYTAFSLNPGQISKLIETEDGCYIIKILEKEEANLEKFEQEEDKLTQSMLKEKQWQILGEWKKNLKEKAKIINRIEQRERD